MIGRIGWCRPGMRVRVVGYPRVGQGLSRWNRDRYLNKVGTVVDVGWSGEGALVEMPNGERILFGQHVLYLEGIAADTTDRADVGLAHRIGLDG